MRKVHEGNEHSFCIHIRVEIEYDDIRFTTTLSVRVPPLLLAQLSTALFRWVWSFIHDDQLEVSGVKTQINVRERGGGMIKA